MFKQQGFVPNTSAAPRAPGPRVSQSIWSFRRRKLLKTWTSPPPPPPPLYTAEPFRRSPALLFRPIDKSLISCWTVFLHAAWSWRLYCRPLQMSYCCHTLLLSDSSDGFCCYALNQPSSSAPDLQDIIVLLRAAEIAQPTHELLKMIKRTVLKGIPIWDYGLCF